MTQRATAFSFSSLLLFIFAAAPAAQAQEGFVINEFLADPGNYMPGEFIEIYNGTGAPLDVSGYVIGDDATNCTDPEFTERYVFPDGTTLEAGESATIFDDANPDVPGFHVEDALVLGNGGDSIALCNDQDVVLDSYTYEGGEVFEGVSQALIPNGNLMNDFQRQDENGAMENVTPGRNNSTGGDLPVEFAGAPTARVDGNAVTLHWRTLTEENNLGFRAQYRRTGPQGSGSWRSAEERVEGAGTSRAEHRYDYTVTDLVPGTYEFRIEQVDTDDGRSHSETVEATVRAAGFALQAPKRNPFDGQTTLTYSAPQNAQVKAVLYNSLGQRVRTLRPSAGRIAIEAGGLASGVYFVRLTSTSGDHADVQAVTLVR